MNNQLVKRLIVFIFLISIVSSSIFFATKPQMLFDVSGVEEVCFVSNSEFEGNFESVKCGEKYFNYCSFEEAKKKVVEIKTADAIQFYTDESDLNKILKQIHFQKMSAETVEGIEITYGYSPYYAKTYIIDGKKINVQIATIDGKAILGFPMIMTGY